MSLWLDWCWKKLGTQVDFEPTTSWLHVRCYIIWATGAHILPPATYVTYPGNSVCCQVTPSGVVSPGWTWMVDEFIIALYGSWSAFARCEKLYWHIDVTLARLVLKKVGDPGRLQTHYLLITRQVLYHLSNRGQHKPYAGVTTSNKGYAPKVHMIYHCWPFRQQCNILVQISSFWLLFVIHNFLNNFERTDCAFNHFHLFNSESV